jgi:hypothetical protein
MTHQNTHQNTHQKYPPNYIYIFFWWVGKKWHKKTDFQKEPKPRLEERGYGNRLKNLTGLGGPERRQS